MTHHAPDPTLSPEEFWDQLYQERPQRWSGKANHALVTTLVDHAPGTALDVGCGEGGDSLWLAERGWQVTGLDISTTALDRARAAAVNAGLDSRITWQQADLADWTPDHSFDLVSAIFLQSPIEFDREKILRALAQWVNPGGLLFIVGHAGWPPWSHHAQDERDAPPGAQQTWASLDLHPHEWDLLVCEERNRLGQSPDGQAAELIDAVILAEHRPAKPHEHSPI